MNFSDIIADYANPPVLTWLDYASPSELRSQLEEYEALLAKMRRLDVVRLTLNANPAAIDGVADDTEADQKRVRRLEVLRERIDDYLPNDISADRLTKHEYPSVLVSAVRAAAGNAFQGSPHLTLHPLSAYVYEDTHQMLTVTCIVLGEREVQHFLEATRLSSFPFATNSWDTVIPINVPYLSPREKLYLDTLIYKVTLKKDPFRLKPGTKFKVSLGPSLEETRQLAERYMQFYRYYPHYHRVHY